jgi:hypothetical protein
LSEEIPKKRLFPSSTAKVTREWSRLEIENFSGKSCLSVQQEFHAKIFSCNVTAILVSGADEIVEKKSVRRKKTYKLNFIQALNRMKTSIVLLLFREKETVGIYRQDQHHEIFQKRCRKAGICEPHRGSLIFCDPVQFPFRTGVPGIQTARISLRPAGGIFHLEKGLQGISVTPT